MSRACLPPRALCAGTTRRAWRAGVVLAALAGALAGSLAGGQAGLAAAQAGEGVPLHAALPAHTLPRLGGYPPYAPDPLHVDTAAARAAWAEAIEGCAGRTAGDVQRGSLYASAAEAWRQVPGAVAHAEACLRAALAALDDRHPLDALARLSLLDLALGEHLAPDALALGARAWDFLERPVPHASDPQAALDAWARERIRTLAPPALLQHAALEGDLATACMWAESMAADPQPAWGEPARLHELAAQLCYRAGRTQQARQHAAEGQRRAGDDETRARLAFWQLHLAHGLLSPTGLLRPGNARPGPGFAAEVAALHAALAGNTQAGTYLLCSASCALQAGALAEALAIYRLALDDPFLVQAAWRHPGLWGGLLPAVKVAEALGRVDEAEQLLVRIEALAGEPVPEAEALRAACARARQRAAQGEARPGGSALPQPTSPARPGTGRLEVATRAPARAPAPGPEASAAAPGTASHAAARALGAALVLAGLLVGACALVGLWRTRRACGRAGPPG